MTKGERLRQLRERTGLAQVDAAERIGVSKQSLYKYEKNIVTNIPSNIIERMAVLYNTTPAYIFGWEDADGNILVETAVVPKSDLTIEQMVAAEELYKLYTQSTPKIRNAIDMLLRPNQN